MLRRTTKQALLALGLAAAAVFASGTPPADAAPKPVVLSAVEGRDAAQGHNVLIVYGARLTLVKTWSLVRTDDTPVDGATVSIKSNTVVVLALPDGITAGSYKIRLATKKPPAIDVPVVLSLLAAPLESIELAQFSVAAQSDLADAETLRGEAPAAFHDASKLVSGIDGVVFTGTPGSGAVPAAGAGTRLMWYPAKSAFRAGSASGAQWDAANIGADSTATGRDATASGSRSTATGSTTTASGNNSTAMGVLTKASGDGSTALGRNGKASGDSSTALGSNTTASGAAATAMGNTTTASGADSTALGQSTIASGDRSTAMGDTTTAQAFASLALGRFNVVAGEARFWTAGDPVLVVGNGSSTSVRSNAFTLLKNGNLTIAGTLTQNSDARLKIDIAPLTGVLTRLRDVRGVSYRFKDGDGPSGPQIGLLAQEVEKAFPELVATDAEGKLSVAYGNFAAVLLEATKEQESVIERQKSEIDALRAALAAMDERLKRVESSR